MNEKITKNWHWYYADDEPPFEETGKYMFFNVRKEVLDFIAKNEIEKYGFYTAKINTEENMIGDEYVLCLYYKDDSRKYELKGRADNEYHCKYRYWKTDLDTGLRKYSPKFIEDVKNSNNDAWKSIVGV